MQTLKKIESDNQRTQHLKAQKQQLQEEVRLFLCSILPGSSRVARCTCTLYITRTAMAVHRMCVGTLRG